MTSFFLFVSLLGTKRELAKKISYQKSYLSCYCFVIPNSNMIKKPAPLYACTLNLYPNIMYYQRN